MYLLIVNCQLSIVQLFLPKRHPICVFFSVDKFEFWCVPLATASDDGLIALHDPSQPSEEAALLSVRNIGAPLRDVGTLL